MAGVFSADCESRCAALEVLYRHWCLDTRFLTELMIEMLRDPEEDVRGWAGGLLAELAEGTCDVRVSRMLASIAVDESRSNRERRAMYYGLLKVRTPLKETAELLFKLGWEEERAYFQARDDDLRFDRVPKMDWEMLRRIINESQNDSGTVQK